jgi:hypothetical protein
MNPLIIDRRKGDYDDRLWEYWAIDMAQWLMEEDGELELTKNSKKLQRREKNR